MFDLDYLQGKNLEGEYRNLQDDVLISRCKDYALWTIPSVFPNQPNTRYNHTGRGNADVQYDFQSIGAGLVNKLSAKLTSLLFPVNNTFFKLNVEGIEELPEDARNEVVRLEYKACSALFENATYAKLIQAVRQLIITGNALLVYMPDGIKVLSLHNYVTKRTSAGDCFCIITREVVYPQELTPEILTKLSNNQKMRADNQYELYTGVIRKKGKDGYYWEVTQEIEGVPVGERVQYPDKFCPYIPAVWNLVTGDNYGRGHVEDYAGDFIKLSELSAALGQYCLESCNIKYLYAPNGVVDVESLTNSEMGEFISGNPEAVTALEAGQYQKIQILSSEIQSIYQRLSNAFMDSTNQRDAERVTAYEVQLAANEAEEVLGGVYSQLSMVLHIPLAYLLCQRIAPEFTYAVQRGEISLDIITGIQALGRAAELQQWLLVTQELGTIIPVLQQISPRFNTEAVINMFLLGHGLDTSAVLLTDEQLQAKLEQQQQQLQNVQQQQRDITSQDATADAAQQAGGI